MLGSEHNDEFYMAEDGQVGQGFACLDTLLYCEAVGPLWPETGRWAFVDGMSLR